MQFVKAPPAAVQRGEWLAVEIRIVNESNGSVKATGKVLDFIRAIVEDFLHSHARGADCCELIADRPHWFMP